MDRVTAARLLGVRPDASTREVDAAFRARVHVEHPDLHPFGTAEWEDATHAMQALTEARRAMRRRPWTTARPEPTAVPEPPTSWERSTVPARSQDDTDRSMRRWGFGWGGFLVSSAVASFAIGAAQPVNNAVPFWSPALGLTGLIAVGLGLRAHHRLVSR